MIQTVCATHRDHIVCGTQQWIVRSQTIVDSHDLDVFIGIDHPIDPPQDIRVRRGIIGAAYPAVVGNAAG